MDKIKNFLKNNEYRIALVLGYVLVASLAYGLGQLSVHAPKVASNSTQTSTLPLNYNGNASGAQTAAVTETSNGSADACQGKIKGSSSLLYHLPGGAFYDKTTHPTRCFNTEAEAQAAGFRKSTK